MWALGPTSSWSGAGPGGAQLLMGTRQGLHKRMKERSAWEDGWVTEFPNIDRDKNTLPLAASRGRETLSSDSGQNPVTDSRAAVLAPAISRWS